MMRKTIAFMRLRSGSLEVKNVMRGHWWLDVMERWRLNNPIGKLAGARSGLRLREAPVTEGVPPPLAQGGEQVGPGRFSGRPFFRLGKSRRKAT